MEQRLCGGCGKGHTALCTDEEDQAYCALCWHKWYVAHHVAASDGGIDDRHTPKPKGKTPGNDALVDANVYSGDEGGEDDIEEELTGEFVEGVLYLVNKRTKVVFHSERDQRGQLKVAGVYQDGKVIVQGTTAGLPWECDEADHCETPLLAYQHIAPLLDALAAILGKTRETLFVYDPYYCGGGVGNKLQQLGFERVYNKCEDFYQVVKEDKVPLYDVLVTNPPYSSKPVDHVAKLGKFLAKSKKPFLIVQPNYVYMKPYWQTSMRKMKAVVAYVTPAQPRTYVYKAPQGFRSLKSKAMSTSPFVTMWYCCFAQYTGHMIKQVASGILDGTGVTFCVGDIHLPDNFKDSSDKTRTKCQAKRPAASDEAGRTANAQSGVAQLSEKEKRERKRAKKKERRARAAEAARLAKEEAARDARNTTTVRRVSDGTATISKSVAKKKRKKENRLKRAQAKRLEQQPRQSRPSSTQNSSSVGNASNTS
eukprot:m.167268 g.167268  ORF g.167268 m.167268 type:complete len:480 (+) comp14456_c0_seq1:306-1745(+)